MWIKTTGPASTATGNNFYGILGARSGTWGLTDISTFNFPSTNEHPGNWILASIDAGNNTQNHTFASASKIMDNAWHLITVTYDGSVHKVYIDGVLISQETKNVALKVVVSFIIGNDPISGHTRFFKGGIDDVRIYDRALSASEVVALKNLTPEGCTQKIEVTDTLRINLLVTSYNPLKYDHTIKVYPNPSNGTITIDHGDYAKVAGYKINILNALGEKVFSGEIAQSKVTLDPSTWTGAGVYVLQIVDSQNYTVDTRKIILE